MFRFLRMSLACATAAACLAAPASALAASSAVGSNHHHADPPQETGFLNRKVEVNGVSYRFMVYLPEEYRRDDGKLWPVILFLHGRGERGSEGMWQTQVGLPSEVRDHPERWPFVIVIPQCPIPAHWTDPPMLAMAMAALDQEQTEFHGDPDHIYLTGLSLGGYGAWELAKLYPHRWAAIAIAAGGIFWSYAPDRWQQSATLIPEYTQAVGRTPIWLFHGSDDPVVPPRESELMFDALKADGGNIRLWIYQGLTHDCWARAYNEPELPHWLLSHKLAASPNANPSLAERDVIPRHPPLAKLPAAALDAIAGEYREPDGHILTIYRQGEDLFVKDQYGAVNLLGAESPSQLFYPNGSVFTRLSVERDHEGRITGILFHDDRHDERWEKQPAVSRQTAPLPRSGD
jgi:poly(3-hydroxybutyrate) depolymerase